MKAPFSIQICITDEWGGEVVSVVNRGLTNCEDEGFYLLNKHMYQLGDEKLIFPPLGLDIEIGKLYYVNGFIEANDIYITFDNIHCSVLN